MKNRFLIIVFIALFGVVYQASARCFENWYIAGSPSIAWHKDHHFVLENLNGDKLHAHRHYKMGWGANASLGYLIEGPNCFNFRPEAEFVYRKNSLKKLKLESDDKYLSDDYSSVGHTKDVAIMANLLMDMPIPSYTCWKIYVGVGLGASRNRLELTKSDCPHHKPPFTSHAWVAARQVMAGLSSELANCLVLTMGYRLFATERVFTPGFGNRSVKTPYTHSVDFGLRLQL